MNLVKIDLFSDYVNNFYEQKRILQVQLDLGLKMHLKALYCIFVENMIY